MNASVRKFRLQMNDGRFHFDCDERKGRKKNMLRVKGKGKNKYNIERGNNTLDTNHFLRWKKKMEKERVNEKEDRETNERYTKRNKEKK